MEIFGEHVTLRPIRADDAERYVRWFLDPEVTKYTIVRKVSLDQELKWIEALSGKPHEHHFSIDDREGKHIGETSLVCSPENEHAEFGIVIGDKHSWNKGIGSEVTKLMLDYGFGTLRLHRIELSVYSLNTYAIIAYRNAGYQVEGSLREWKKLKNGYCDKIIMGIIRSEWEAKR